MAQFQSDVVKCRTEEAQRQSAAIVATQHATANKAERASIMQKLELYSSGGDDNTWLCASSDAELESMPLEMNRLVFRLRVVSKELKQAITEDPSRVARLKFTKDEIASVERQSALTDEDIARIVDGARAIVAKEKSCRTDKACAGKRSAARAEDAFFATVVTPMCLADQRREQCIADIAHERKNPSGYVDKALLHDLGSQQQDAEEDLRALTPAYSKFRHKKWPGWRKECDASSP